MKLASVRNSMGIHFFKWAGKPIAEIANNIFCSSS